VGLFKSMKDLADVTKSAKQLQEQQQRDAGYKPGMGGMVSQMGDMLADANTQLKDLTGSSGDRAKLLAEGIAGEGVVIGHGTPERGAQWFNLDIDMEIHVPGRAPYQVNNQYMVPAGATLGPGVRLPIRVDPEDKAKIAIDWDSAGRAPARGEVRPAGGAAPPASAPAATPSSGSPGDSVAELERLAKLRDSGALTDAEFEAQKAKVLGGG
jgi:Short C-terminal domain